jgi:hypothetical protein
VKAIEKECEKFLGVVLGEAVELRRVLADAAFEVARCHGREVARPHPLQQRTFIVDTYTHTCTHARA